jgi:cyclophilin family peptidyl-prolyl cis-trans isomerase
MLPSMKSMSVFVGLIVIGIVAAVVLSNQPKPTAPSDLQLQTSPNSESTLESSMTPSATPAANAQTQKQLAKPSMTIDPNKTYTAVLHTTKGDVTIQLNAKQTPVTVNNFVYLSKQAFYNNTPFHRVINGFMIQGGDPTGTGTGGPGYRFEDEKFEGEYTRGTVAMANAGPNTNGSQFFIMHQDNPLPPNYVIFGKVTTGMEVVDAIATAEVEVSGMGERSKPKELVRILTIDIIEK